jgi:hypothetical protein
MQVLKRCLEAAQAVALDPWVVRKTDYPTRDDFDKALEELADVSQLDGERFYKAYGRAFQSPEGQMLYAARSRAPVPHLIRKREPAPTLTKAEKAIADAVTGYVAEHPDCSREKALLKVLESPEGQKLYADYETERAEELTR